MKKNFYRVTNLVLSSLITLLGFGACKTAKNVGNESAVAGTESAAGRDSIAGNTPNPSATPEGPVDRNRVVLLYGVRAPREVIAVPDKKNGEEKK